MSLILHYESAISNITAKEVSLPMTVGGSMDHGLPDLILSSGDSNTDREHQHDPTAAWITNMASRNARTKDINMSSDSSMEQGY